MCMGAAEGLIVVCSRMLKLLISVSVIALQLGEKKTCHSMDLNEFISALCVRESFI